MRPAALTAVALGMWACGCGDAEDPLRWRDPEDLRTVLQIESAPPGLLQAVGRGLGPLVPRRPSCPRETRTTWRWRGPFRIEFRNTSDEPLQMRYDLRFFDEDGFLIDWFIPFGQPVVFAAGQTRLEEGASWCAPLPTRAASVWRRCASRRA